MTVDSEAIFALAEATGNDPHAFEQLNGSMATAWLDDRHVHTMFLGRGVGRPLWIGTADDELLFASTKAALEVAERFLRLKLRKREVGEGTVAVVTEGVVVEKLRFRPDRDFEERTLPAVRAPQEAKLSLQRLTALASIS
jgi:asparagine synthetase B (glutamine-hydrolysing)